MLTGDGFQYGYQAAANSFDYTMNAWGAHADTIKNKTKTALNETFAYCSAAAHMLTGETPQYGYQAAKNTTSYVGTAYSSRFGKKQ